MYNEKVEMCGNCKMLKKAENYRNTVKKKVEEW